MSDTTLPKTAKAAQPAKQPAGPVHPREQVLFYRSAAHFSPIGNCWHLQVRGSIYSSSKGRIHKQALLHLFKRVVKPENTQEIKRRFLDRAQLFLQNTRKGKSVPIAIAEKAYALPGTSPNGHFETTLTVPATELEGCLQRDAFGRRFAQFCTQLPDADQRLFAGEVELIAPAGISVISDVDDTIKVTNVGNRKELLANTFTREFRSVEGMRELYQRWASAGLSFHYVSASPWPLYGPLVDWLDGDRFPLGTLHLRHVRLRDLPRDRRNGNSFSTKRAAIENLLRTFPQRHFILCGDSGERDAELYTQIERDFGQQVLHIAIRRVPGAKDAHSTLEHLRLLDPARWTLFEHPAELDALLQQKFGDVGLPAR